MSIFTNALARLGYMKATPGAIYPEWLHATAGAERETQIDPAKWSNQADLYRRLSWVNIAVSMIAKAASTTPFSVFGLQGDDREDIANHPFELLLAKPNPLMSRYEFIYSTASYQALTGNAYWWLNKANPNAAPSEIWVIPAHMIKPVPDEQMFLKGYLYDPGDGQEIALETHEVAHFKEFNPHSVFVGLSKIEALATIAVGDMQMQKWNTKLFADNNARLPGILAFSDPIRDSDWERLKQDSADNAKKRQLMMLRNVGPGGVQWIQNAATQKDMEFLAGRNFTKEEIFSVYAPGLSSMLAVNATEANARTGQSTFSEFAVWPLLVSMAEKITNDILPYYNGVLIGEFDDIRYRDRALELSEMSEYARTHTIDEVRSKYYNDEALPDFRGTLLPLQVGAAPLPMPPGAMPAPTTPPVTTAEPDNDPEQAMDEAQEVEDNPAMDDELKAWRKFSVARFGKAARPFECEHLPEHIQEIVTSGLKTCQNVDEVRDLFDGIDLTAKPHHEPEKGHRNDYTPLVTALGEAVKALHNTPDDKQPISVNVSMPAQTFNIPETRVNVEAAKAAEIQPVINVHPSEVPVNVNVSPTPVTVENVVNLPESKPKRTVVERGLDGNIREMITSDE